MVPVKEKRTELKHVVMALHECRDLLQCGYLVRFSSYSEDFLFIKLKHQTTGNEIIIKSSTLMMSITKNGKVVKTPSF